MRETHRLLMQTAMSGAGRSRGAGYFPLPVWGARGALALAALSAASFIQTQDASAVPAYARQTGQTCATCHTAFPELTPFGRQFKLMGYTSGGTRCDDGSAKSDTTQVPLAVMAWPATFTNVKSKAAQADLGAIPNLTDNSWMPSQFSLFIAGQYYCNVGGFTQITYDRTGPNHFNWDNTDIRYAKTGVIDGTNIVYGITANNNPSVQDVWNTAPAWFFPYITSEVAPSPANGTMLATSQFGAQVGGVGGYVWLDNMFYAELTAYGALQPGTAVALGADPTANRFNGAAPYWRLAVEKTWDKNSLMFGTLGMFADQQMTNTGAGLGGPANALATSMTDPTLDLGLDAQYQWIGEDHIFTARALYVWQTKKNNIENNFLGMGANASDQLNDLNISATYIYDRTYSFTAGYFNTWGTSDINLYGTTTGSPNSSGWNLDVAYLPFMNGGPELWPWFNARIGIQYTHYDRFDGSSSWVDVNSTNGANIKASGNDTVFLYTWLMF